MDHKGPFFWSLLHAETCSETWHPAREAQHPRPNKTFIFHCLEQRSILECNYLEQIRSLVREPWGTEKIMENRRGKIVQDSPRLCKVTQTPGAILIGTRELLSHTPPQDLQGRKQGRLHPIFALFLARLHSSKGC